MDNRSFRPAGMSDSSEDEYEDDGFTFHTEVEKN